MLRFKADSNKAIATVEFYEGGSETAPNPRVVVDFANEDLHVGASRVAVRHTGGTLVFPVPRMFCRDLVLRNHAA